MILAGLPPIQTLSEKSFVTTAPAAITTLFPIVTPGQIAPPPIQTLFPIVMGLANFLSLFFTLNSMSKLPQHNAHHP